MKLEGKRVLITGGSAGLGAAVAERFIQEGAAIAINYASSKEQATKLQERLQREYSKAKIVVIQGDVSKSATCSDLISSTVEQLGGIDCVVSNAGWTKASSWEDLDAYDEEEWDRSYAMNIKSHMFLFKYAKPHFLQNADGGNLIITTSVAGTKQVGSSLAYSVAKHGAIALARGLALHQGPKCRINTVAPGLLETDWSTKQFGQERMDAMKDITPLKRNASLSDCADAFLLLATSSSITGQTIVVDGGFGLR